MRACLLPVVALALAACTVSSDETQWQEVSTSSVVVEQTTQAEAAHALEQFLSAQGWSKRGGDDAGGRVHRWFESRSAPGTRVGVNNDATRYCFNFSTWVDAKSPDRTQANAIASAFLSEFGAKPGWRVSPGMPCPVEG